MFGWSWRLSHELRDSGSTSALAASSGVLPDAVALPELCTGAVPLSRWYSASDTRSRRRRSASKALSPRGSTALRWRDSRSPRVFFLVLIFSDDYDVGLNLAVVVECGLAVPPAQLELDKYSSEFG